RLTAEPARPHRSAPAAPSAPLRPRSGQRGVVFLSGGPGMDAKLLLDNLEHGVVAIAPDWTLAAWTAAAARITGLPADRVMGQSFWVAFPAARATHIERVLQEVLHDGKPQMYLAPAAATDFPGMVFETQVSRGPHNHLIMVFRQVREQLGPESRAAHLMSALETERRLYLQLFSSLPTPALVLTVDGQILESNPEGVKLLGVADPVALRGRPMGDWTPAAHRAPLAAALRDAVTQRQEVRLTVEYAGEPPRDVRAVIVNVDPMRQSPKLLFLALVVSRESLLLLRLLQAYRLSKLSSLVSGGVSEYTTGTADEATKRVNKCAQVNRDQRSTRSERHHRTCNGQPRRRDRRRHRARHATRNPRTGVRALLHHQGRTGHGPRSGDQ